MIQPVVSEHIEISPDVCGGSPCIAGHRIRVRDVVVWHEQLGLSPDEIVSQYPQIALADVYAALAYYHDHREEIRQEIERDRDLVRDMKKSLPSKLLDRLAGDDAAEDPVPSR